MKLSEAARAYACQTTRENYNSLRKCLFELEWRDLVEEIITEEHKQTNNDVAKGMLIAKSIVKDYMRNI